MKKKFYLNIFLLLLQRGLVKPALRKWQVSFFKNLHLFADIILSTGRIASVGLQQGLAAVFSKVLTPLPAVSLAPY